MNTENNFTEDFQMAEYILKILSLRKITLMSWGFHSPKVIKDGLEFNVNGFLHQGLVQVIYQHGVDLFKIRFVVNENELVKEITEVYVDDLIDVIDQNVEIVENYKDRVKQEYCNIHFQEK